MPKYLTFLFLLVIVACNKNIEWVNPKKDSLVEAIYGLGTVNATKSYHVQTGVALRIEQLKITEGDEVNLGQSLIRFENGTQIQAPFAGTITKILIKENELATPGTILLTLQDLKDLYIEVSLEQQFVMKVRKGQNVRLIFENLAGKIFESTVQAVYPRDQNFIVRIPFPEINVGVLPGMTADVAINIGSKDNAWLIPAKSIHQGQIFLDTGSGYKKTKVEIGIIDGTMAEILSPQFNGTEKIKVK